MIATGTCGGVGYPRGLFVKPRDRTRIAGEGLGEMSNTVVADSPAA